MQFWQPVRWLATIMAVVAYLPVSLTSSVTLAQAPVRYVIHEVPLINPDYSANEINQMGLAVGRHFPDGVGTGYVYDHYGLLGQPHTTHALSEWVPVPAGWGSSCVGINDLGQVVGLLEDLQSVETLRRGFLLDLDVLSATPAPTWRFLPDVPGNNSYYGRRINNHGVALIGSQHTRGEYLYDTLSPSAVLMPLMDPSTNTFITDIRFQEINDYSQLSGAGSGAGWRLTPGLELLEIPGVDVRRVRINQSGGLGLTLEAIRDKRGRITQPARAARVSDATGIEVLSDLQSSVYDINDQGDVVGDLGGLAIFTDEHGWVNLDSVIDGSATDVDFWLNAGGYYVQTFILNRGHSGFGDIYAIKYQIVTTGKGKNAVTTRVNKHFYLQAELP